MNCAAGCARDENDISSVNIASKNGWAFCFGIIDCLYCVVCVTLNYLSNGMFDSKIVPLIYSYNISLNSSQKLKEMLFYFMFPTTKTSVLYYRYIGKF